MSNDLNQRLEQIAQDLKEGGTPNQPTVRALLSWVGAKRRGSWNVALIRSAMSAAGLTSEPDFESIYIDSPVNFQLDTLDESAEGPADGPVDDEGNDSETLDSDTLARSAFNDPTYSVSKLLAANQPPTYVAPDADLSEAVSEMLASGYSQLPVMINEREVKGVLTWEGIGSRLALGTPPGPVRNFMDVSVIVPSDESLFRVIEKVAADGYVLVRSNTDRRISGIVSASDLSLQFRQLTEPFLLLGEIENHVRRIIDNKFDLDDLVAARDPTDSEREVASVADLTFGEYGRLLQDPGRWSKLNISLSRTIFVRNLDRVRQIRNDVMHFDPDGVPDEDLATLRDFSLLLQRLQLLGAT